jgi:hypothetical protein
VAGLLTFIGALVAIWVIALISHVIPLAVLVYGSLAVAAVWTLFAGVPGD